MSATTILIIGTILFLTLSFSIVFFVLIHQKRMFENQVKLKEKESAHQKKLIHASIEVAELERQKIAKDIHDDVGSSLNVINLNLNRIARNSDNKELSKDLINESKLILETTIETIRGISRDLMPPILNKLGYVKGIEELCRQISKTGIITVTIENEKVIFNVSKKIEIQLYRIVQELLNNIIKHAKATHIHIELNETDLDYYTKITHNGDGINVEAINKLSESSKGVGLRSIESRAQMINAAVQYIVMSTKESVVSITISKDTDL